MHGNLCRAKRSLAGAPGCGTWKVKCPPLFGLILFLVVVLFTCLATLSDLGHDQHVASVGPAFPSQHGTVGRVAFSSLPHGVSLRRHSVLTASPSSWHMPGTHRATWHQALALDVGRARLRVFSSVPRPGVSFYRRLRGWTLLMFHVMALLVMCRIT